jgi:hypothetical protein
MLTEQLGVYRRRNFLHVFKVAEGLVANGALQKILRPLLASLAAHTNSTGNPPMTELAFLASSQWGDSPVKPPKGV